MSLTVSNTRARKTLTLSVEGSKSAGTTPGDVLAAGITAAVAKHGIKGRVTAVSTACEISMAMMGRILEENCVCTHVGCWNHRLESTTSLVFNGPGVQKAMTLARGRVIYTQHQARWPTGLRSSSRPTLVQTARGRSKT